MIHLVILSAAKNLVRPYFAETPRGSFHSGGTKKTPRTKMVGARALLRGRFRWPYPLHGALDNALLRLSQSTLESNGTQGDEHEYCRCQHKPPTPREEQDPDQATGTGESCRDQTAPKEDSADSVVLVQTHLPVPSVEQPVEHRVLLHVTARKNSSGTTVNTEEQSTL